MRGRRVTDDRWFAPGHRMPPRVPRPGELVWEFRRQDHHTFSCELRFHGESFGWEAQILEDGELFYSHGAFITKAAPVS